MRWFKHMAASWDDEKLAGLVDQHGLEGYGFWWRVVEVVAAKVDKSEQTSAEFPAKKWGSLLGLSPKKFRMLAECCANLGLFSLEFSQNSIRIDMPNILKFRDEYTEKEARKSGAGRDKLRSSRARSSETDTEAETDVKEKKEYSASAAPAAAPASCAPPVEEPMPEPAASPALPKAVQPVVVPKLDPPGGEPAYRTKKGRLLKGRELRDFEGFWQAFALARGKAEAADAWLDIRGKTPELVQRICDAARREAAERAAAEARGRTPKWAQGWLAARRWEDYAPSSTALSPATRVALSPPEIPDPTPEDLERTRRNALRWRDRLHGGAGAADAERATA